MRSPNGSSSRRCGPAVLQCPAARWWGSARWRWRVLETAATADVEVEVRPGESFLDLTSSGRASTRSGTVYRCSMGDPSPIRSALHLPTLITQVDSPLVAGDVAITLGRLLPDEVIVTVLDRLGDADERVVTTPLQGPQQDRSRAPHDALPRAGHGGVARVGHDESGLAGRMSVGPGPDPPQLVATPDRGDLRDG